MKSHRPRQACSPNCPPPATGSPESREAIAKLTLREREVLGWLMQGKRNSEIAIILGCSVNTVHKHVHRILAKLGVETRTAAGHQATIAGFTPPQSAA